MIIDSAEGTLLTKRSEKASWPGLWHTIGSTLMRGETCGECALSGMKNEIGLVANIQDLKFLENVEFPIRTNDYKTGGHNNELSVFYYLDKPDLKLEGLRLDKNTAEVRLFKPNIKKPNYGLPAPMLPQHVYMISKFSRHFEGVRNRS
jgi:ADP-ribose pyrophosphatase YjhB (NUDIX family)